MARKKTTRSNATRRAPESSWPDPFPIPVEEQTLRDYFGSENYERFQREGWGSKPFQNLASLTTLFRRRSKCERLLQECSDLDGRSELELKYRDIDSQIEDITLLLEGQLNHEVWDQNRRPETEGDRRLAELRAAFDLTSIEGVQDVRQKLLTIGSPSSREDPAAVRDSGEQRRKLEELFAQRDGDLIKAIYEMLPVNEDGRCVVSAKQITLRLRNRNIEGGLSPSSVTRTINTLKDHLGDEIRTRGGGGGGSWKTIDRLDTGDH